MQAVDVGYMTVNSINNAHLQDFIQKTLTELSSAIAINGFIDSPNKYKGNNYITL